MKRTIAVFALAFVLILSACGQGAGADGEGDIIVIGERFFVNQVVEIVMNANQYTGRTIQFEGIFRAINNAQTGDNHFFVMRFTQGCCGIEMIGLEVLMEDRTPIDDDAWVEVTGILEIIDGLPMLRVTAIIEMDERGAEFVS